MPVGRITSLLQRAVVKGFADRVPRLGAALAFYAALSMAPMFVLLLKFTSVFFSEEAARDGLVAQIQSLAGEPAAVALKELIARGGNPVEGRVAAALGLVMLFFGASGVFAQLQDALDTIWQVRPKPDRTWLDVIRERLFSFVMVLGICFLLLTSLVISAMLAALGEIWGQLPTSLRFVAQGMDLVVSFGVVTVLFAAMYKWVPDVEIRWGDVWFGAAITAAMFIVGKFAIGFYLGHSAVASSYGVAGSFVVVLIWIYYSAQILFFGAEITQVHTQRRGRKVAVSSNAERARS